MTEGVGRDILKHRLQEAMESQDGGAGEVVLDFTDVRQIDAGVLEALDRLAGAAGERSRRVVLRGVSTDIYKVLKLARLAPRFSFEE
jgi:anti-anti-sigma regulatory factor